MQECRVSQMLRRPWGFSPEARRGSQGASRAAPGKSGLHARGEGVPGGPVVKNLPSNAGDVGSIPGWGTKIPYASQQLSLCAATIEPVLQRLGAAPTEARGPWSPFSATTEATAIRSLYIATTDRPLLTAAREKPVQP